MELSPHSVMRASAGVKVMFNRAESFAGWKPILIAPSVPENSGTPRASKVDVCNCLPPLRAGAGVPPPVHAASAMLIIEAATNARGRLIRRTILTATRRRGVFTRPCLYAERGGPPRPPRSVLPGLKYYRYLMKLTVEGCAAGFPDLS